MKTQEINKRTESRRLSHRFSTFQVAFFTLMATVYSFAGDPNLLQACSYDGSALRLHANQLVPNAVSDANKVVSDIMEYTGLPQNFEVVEGQVPNAAAVIVMGKDNLPHRVIAYNRDFMKHVRQATQNNDWASISIMAHEIGHHLCGHTILPGGSQPPTELEADKFSGFVLYKMGASLADAQIAMETLVPDRDSPTHPARSKRVSAIQDGWQSACRQQSEDCKDQAKTTSVSTVASKPVPSMPSQGTSSPGTPAVHNQPDVMPSPDPNAIPSKFDRFVVDELGILDPAVKTKLAKDMFDYAESHNVEIVTLIVKDLHGLSAEAYGYDMMRQLRVGKLDVGNGAVLVIAPNQNQVGIALGAGIFNEFRDRLSLIESPLRSFMKNYNTCSSCPKTWSPSVARASDLIRRDTQSWEWVIRYQSLEDMLAASSKEADDRRTKGGSYNPLESSTWRKLVRVQGELTTPSPEAERRIMPSRIPEGGQALALRTAEGKSLIVYADSHVASLMPVAIQAGKSYSMVLREYDLHTLSFDLASFDLLN